MTTQLEELHEYKRQFIELVEKSRANYDRRVAKNQPQIDELSRQADELAVVFKRLVKEAAEAYAADDGELAKVLSDERKAKQAECEALNQRANRLRQELARDYESLQRVQSYLAMVLKDIERLTAETSPSRHVKLAGFQQARGVTPEIVRQELDPLPPRLLEKIVSVTYIDEVARDGAVGRTANKAQNPDQTKVYLYINLFSVEESELKESYRDTIVHEAGHVLFDWVMNSVQRWEWGKLYNQTLRDGESFITEYAGQSMREDFGECFMKYIRYPTELRRNYMARYTFIDKVYKEINT